MARAFELTCGQSWLVNTLAREIVDKMRIAPREPITVEHVEQTKARLILARATSYCPEIVRLAIRRWTDDLKKSSSPGSGRV